MINLLLLEGGIRSSPAGNIGIISLLGVPVMLLAAIILAIAKRKKLAKKALIGAGICALIGVGLCGIYWSN